MATKERIFIDALYSAVVEQAYHRANIPTIRVSSRKSHHELLFIADEDGLYFWCKRCGQEHGIEWYYYNRIVQELPPPYHVLCVHPAGTFLLRADEPFPADHLRSYRMFTIPGDMSDLLGSIAEYLNNRQEML